MKRRFEYLRRHDSRKMRDVAAEFGWPIRHFQTWSPMENEVLWYWESKGESIQGIAEKLGRKTIAVFLHMEKIRSTHPELQKRLPIHESYESGLDSLPRWRRNQRDGMPLRHCESWSSFEQDLVKRLIREGRCVEEIAKFVQRTENGVFCAIEKYDLG